MSLSYRLETCFNSLYPSSTQPFGLTVFSQQSFSSHSTPPSHCFAANCSSPSHCGCSLSPQFSTSALLDNYSNSLHVPGPKSPLLPVERDFRFSVFRGLLFALSLSILFYHNCSVHTVTDLSCIREPLIVHWVLHRAGSMCS